MEILGIGPSELIFIIIIALIVLGPKDMQKAGRTIGKWLRRLVMSDGWKAFQQTSREIQTLPNRLMREAALDELKELQRDLKQPLQADRRIAAPGSSTGGGTPDAQAQPAPETETKILPPEVSATPPPTDEKQDD